MAIVLSTIFSLLALDFAKNTDKCSFPRNATIGSYFLVGMHIICIFFEALMHLLSLTLSAWRHTNLYHKPSESRRYSQHYK